LGPYQEKKAFTGGRGPFNQVRELVRESPNAEVIEGDTTTEKGVFKGGERRPY